MNDRLKPDAGGWRNLRNCMQLHGERKIGQKEMKRVMKCHEQLNRRFGIVLASHIHPCIRLLSLRLTRPWKPWKPRGATLSLWVWRRLSTSVVHCGETQSCTARGFLVFVNTDICWAAGLVLPKSVHDAHAHSWAIVAFLQCVFWINGMWRPCNGNLIMAQVPKWVRWQLGPS